MWGAARRLKLGELEDEYVAAEEALDDPALTLAERNKLRNLKRQLIRDMNEMCDTCSPERPSQSSHHCRSGTKSWDSTGRSGVISWSTLGILPLLLLLPLSLAALVLPLALLLPMRLLLRVEPERHAAAQRSAISRSMSWGPGNS
jgi:hypothetical protein